MILLLLFVVLCILVYRNLIRELKLHNEFLVNLAYAITLSVIVTIFMSAFLNLVSLYNTRNLVISQILLNAIFLVFRPRSKQAGTTASWKNFPFVSHWRSILIVAIAVIIYIPPSTIVVGGQDPGWYAAAASMLSRTDGFEKKLPGHSILIQDASFKSMLLEGGARGRSEYNGSGLVQNGDGIKLWYDFQRGPSYIIAYFMKIFGIEWGFVACSLLSILAVLVFYGFSSSFLQPNSSFLAALLLTLCPSEIWFGKASYSEIPSQLFIFFALVAVLPLLSIERDQTPTLRKKMILIILAAFSTAAAFMMRLDQMTLVAAVLFSFPFLMTIAKYYGRSRMKREDWCMVIGIQCALIALFAFSFWESYAANPVYYNNMKSLVFPFLDYLPLILLGGAVGALLLTFIVNNRRYFHNTLNFLDRLIKAPLSVQIYSFLILKLLIWGLILRLVDEPFEMFGSNANHNSGVRTMNEHIFVRLAVMVGLPNLILGFWGAYEFIKDTKKRLGILILLSLFVFYAVNLLPDQMNSPMLYWATRRYLPVIVPCLILFGTYILIEKLPRILKVDFRVLQVGLIIIAFYPMLKWGPYVWEHSEMKGAYKVVSNLDKELKKLPHNLDAKYVLFSDTEDRHFNFTLSFFSDYEVIQLSQLITRLKTNKADFERFFQILAAQGFQAILVVTLPEFDAEIDAQYSGKYIPVEAKFIRMEQIFKLWPRRTTIVDHSYKAKVIEIR